MTKRSFWSPAMSGCLVSGLIVSAITCSVARAEEPSLDAKTLMERINETYEGLRSQGRRVTMTYRTITRAPGKPDVYVTGTSVAHQKDDKIRYEQAEDAYRTEVPADESAESESQGGDMLWIHDGDILWSRNEAAGADPDDECGVREFYIDHRRIPEAYGPKWTQPMLEAELSEEFLEHPFSLHQSVLEGKPVYILRSAGRVPLSPENAMAVTFWVDPESYLVLRMESEAAWYPSPDIESYVDGEYDITYEIGVPTPDSMFEIEISERAEDLTDVIAQKIGEKLEWQGKLPEGAAPPVATEIEQREWRCPPIG